MTGETLNNSLTLEDAQIHIRETFAIQQLPVCGDLHLQLHLGVEQSLVVLRLQLDLVAELSELCLQSQGDAVQGLDFHIVARFGVSQRALQ